MCICVPKSTAPLGRAQRAPNWTHLSPISLQRHRNGSNSSWRTSDKCKQTGDTSVATSSTRRSKFSANAVEFAGHHSDVLSPNEEPDAVVIGSGIGGLSCAALLAFYGFKVVVCESHSVPGGAAHCWTRRGCHFDSGTALFFGLPSAAAAIADAVEAYNPSNSLASAGMAAASGIATAVSVADSTFDAHTSSSSRHSSSSGRSSSSSSSSSSGRQYAHTAAPSSTHGSSDNPLAAVLELLQEPLDLIPYGPNRTCLVFPEGTFNAQIGSALFPAVVEQLWGSTAKQEWLQLQQLCSGLASAAVAMHPMVVRYDSLVALTAAARRPGRFLRFLASKPRLLEDHVMFSELVDSVVSHPQLREFLDVLCQGTSGAPAASIPAAYMVRAFTEMYQPGTQLQWPRGGPQAIANALVRGLRKHGGKLLLNCHVTSVLQDRAGRATGVVLKNGSIVKAKKAVISNASIWDTQKLLPGRVALPDFQQQVLQVAPSDSFVHLHAVVNQPSGVTAAQLPVHSYFLSPQLVGDTGWPTLTIATAVDDTLALPGKQVLHAYMAEPYTPWQHLTRGSKPYQQLKQQKAEQLWTLIDQVVPWARPQLDWQMVGTPLTHQHFRRRYMGAYGPKAMRRALATGKEGVSIGGQHELQGSSSGQPQAVQPMKGMYCCGDCTFPWIGTPAVAASGMWVANTLAPVWKHWAAANKVDR